MVSVDTAVELGGLPGSHGRTRWLLECKLNPKNMDPGSDTYMKTCELEQ